MQTISEQLTDNDLVAVAEALDCLQYRVAANMAALSPEMRTAVDKLRELSDKKKEHDYQQALCKLIEQETGGI
ncbi:unnamed protein product [marine sediment metagenome]|uniref:Uncharacterized protein n=1 Tax=marine sediment metagenome TaxID=412755 RepID=X0UW88_9ZZZZ